MRRGLRSSALVLAAAATLTSACGTSQAGSAAVVGDRRITVTDLQQATRQIETFAGQQVAQQQVLFYLIAEPYLVRAAEQAQVGVSEDDAREDLAAKVPSPAQSTIAALRANRAISQLQGLEQGKAQSAIQGVVTAITQAAPRVNPRYGSWDAKNLSIVDSQQNWLVPSATPSPAASPAPGDSPSPSPSPATTP